MSTNKLALAAARNAALQTAYVGLVALFFSSVPRLMGDKPGVLGFVVFLLLFCLSALVSGILILGQPVWLYLEGKKRESVKLLGLTVAALVVCLAAVLTVIALLR